MMSFLKKQAARSYTPIAWTIFVILLCCLPGSILPNEARFPIPQFDKFVHITLFGGFVLLWNFYLGGRTTSNRTLLRWFFYMFVAGCALGVGTELMQKYFIPRRDFDTEDIIADMIGAGLAYGISNMYFINV